MKETKMYLITPENFDTESIIETLPKLFLTNKIGFFQLRIKNASYSDILYKAKKIRHICQDYNVKFIINDYYHIALEVGADGVHLGFENDNIYDFFEKKKSAIDIPENFIIGLSCYDKKEYILKSQKLKSTYISLGSFFKSKTKKSIGKPNLDLLNWKEIKLPIVAIGGINNKNYKSLFNKVDYIALISYVWNHPISPKYAIDSFDI